MATQNISKVGQIIKETRQVITHGRKPEGNCTYWNQDLSIALRMNGIPAIPYGSPTYEIKTKDKGKTMGHAICVCKEGDTWRAIDLSSEQVQGLDPEKIWEADSLKELATMVNIDLPNFISYLEGDEESMLEAAKKSSQKDLAEGRYDKFMTGASIDSKG